jgi:hypothetical protein
MESAIVFPEVQSVPAGGAPPLACAEPPDAAGARDNSTDASTTGELLAFSASTVIGTACPADKLPSGAIVEPVLKAYFVTGENS